MLRDGRLGYPRHAAICVCVQGSLHQSADDPHPQRMSERLEDLRDVGEARRVLQISVTNSLPRPSACGPPPAGVGGGAAVGTAPGRPRRR